GPNHEAPTPSSAENGTRNFTDAANHIQYRTRASCFRNASVRPAITTANSVDCHRWLSIRSPAASLALPTIAGTSGNEVSGALTASRADCARLAAFTPFFDNVRGSDVGVRGSPDTACAPRPTGDHSAGTGQSASTAASRTIWI